MKAHGVVVAIPQEQSWAPRPVDRSGSERGNCSALPSSRASGTGTGRRVVRCGRRAGRRPRSSSGSHDAVVEVGKADRRAKWASKSTVQVREGQEIAGEH